MSKLDPPLPAPKKEETVQKFNPNHGPDGRFVSGPGGSRRARVKTTKSTSIHTVSDGRREQVQKAFSAAASLTPAFVRPKV